MARDPTYIKVAVARCPRTAQAEDPVFELAKSRGRENPVANVEGDHGSNELWYLGISVEQCSGLVAQEFITSMRRICGVLLV